MSDLSEFLDEIDIQRILRARELSEIKSRFATGSIRDVFHVQSKAVVVLSYAHWEGFYNDCVGTYLRLLRSLRLNVRDVEWMMLAGVISGELARLADRNHSPDARCDFVESLRTRLGENFDGFDANVILARSNLDFARLKQNFRILQFDLNKFQSRRIKLDKELVGWRHQVAHGGSPDLSAMDMAAHLDFAADLLLTLSDGFQDAMTARF
jgi:hypothetical protein